MPVFHSQPNQYKHSILETSSLYCSENETILVWKWDCAHFNLFYSSTCSIGIVFGFLGNQKISDSIRGFENTADSALQDGVNYLNDTINVSEEREVLSGVNQATFVYSCRK